MTPADWNMYDDKFGRGARDRELARDMISPVRCTHCRSVYDLCKGEPVARYADCTVYKTPCCGRTVDDRPAGWVSQPAFTRIDQ